MSRSLVVLCDGSHLQRRTDVVAVQRVSAGHYLQHLLRLKIVLEEVKVGGGGGGGSLRPLRLLKIVGIGVMFTALKTVQLLIVVIVFIIIV